MQIGQANAAILNAPINPAARERTAQDRDATLQATSAVRTLNESQVAGTGRELSIAIDAQTKQPIIQIVDSSTQEVIDQIPTKFAIELAASVAAENKSNNGESGR